MSATVLAAWAIACGPGAAPSDAAGAPQVDATWVTDVTATSANLRADIDANGEFTTYRFEFLSEASYQANIAASHDPFSGAIGAPAAASAPVGAGTTGVEVVQHVSGLTPSTTYRYRVLAFNGSGTAVGVARSLGSEPPTNVLTPLDGRSWEMVSPLDKGGGAVSRPGTLFGGGAFQAAADGGSVTYGSSSSFAGGLGAPGGSQYISRRSALGWSTENITAPSVSGSYGSHPDGTPFRLFSGDLSRGLLLNGERCRNGEGECPVANPPLPGSGASPGFQDFYLRDGGTGAFASLLDSTELSHTPLSASQFELGFAGAAPSLGQVVVSSCAALSPEATETPAAGGCDPEAQNLYLWAGDRLRLLNRLPGDATGTPGAALAAPVGAISEAGERVYWVDSTGALYLAEPGGSKAVDESGDAEFQVASSDGSVAYYLAAAHLYRYEAGAGTSTDLTPGGGVVGVLGASADASVVYFQTATGLFVWRSGVVAEVAPGAEVASSSDFPPATATARVSADGRHLLFVSTTEPTGYENLGLDEVFLYGPPVGGGAPILLCASCSPTGERPQGGSRVPGAVANGSTVVYRPRVLSEDGERAFFASEDTLSTQDTNGRPDVYEWEAYGEGTCQRQPGCVQLISSGRAPEGATIVDASANGSDVFILTGESLVTTDPGSIDLYDARVRGGFPVAPTPIPCEGDACQALPEAPEDPSPATLLPNSGNPARHFSGTRKHRHRKRRHKRHRHHHHRHRHGKGHGNAKQHHGQTMGS